MEPRDIEIQPSLGDGAIIHGDITMALPLRMAIVRHLAHNFPQKIKHVISFHTMFSVNNKNTLINVDAVVVSQTSYKEKEQKMNFIPNLWYKVL